MMQGLVVCSSRVFTELFLSVLRQRFLVDLHHVFIHQDMVDTHALGRELHRTTPNKSVAKLK